MNTGAVSTRYARALLLYATGKAAEDGLYAEIKSLLALSDKPGSELPELSEIMKDFLELVIGNGRKDHLVLIFNSYLRQYREKKGIVKASLTTVAEDDEIEKRVLEMLSKQGIDKVEMEHKVDSGLVGGFVLQLEDRRLDASVSRQLETLRRGFEEKNRRII